MIDLFSLVTNRSYLKGLNALLLTFVLISCSDTDGDPEDIVGVAATGEATRGTVYVVDAEGVELSKPLNADGYFRFDVRGMTAPFMLKSVDSNGIDIDLFSYALEANLTANITPLTNLTLYMATGEPNPSVLYDSWASSFVNVDDADIKNAQAVVNANLSLQYTAFSLDPLTYDFFASIFYTDGTSFDGLLDVLTVDLLPVIDISVMGIADLPAFDPNVDVAGFDIGGESVVEIGAYSLSLEVTVDGEYLNALVLSVNWPADSVPVVGGDTQVIEEMFITYHAVVGDIVINSVSVTVDEWMQTTVVVDSIISTTDYGDLNYVGYYVFVENI